MVGNIFESIFLSGQLSRNTKTHSTHPLYAEWHMRPQGRLQIIIQARLQSINRVRLYSRALGLLNSLNETEK